jgi:hypothetical protein
MMLIFFLLRRSGGRPMLSGLLLMVCGIALVVIWALSGGSPHPHLHRARAALLRLRHPGIPPHQR